MKLSLSLCILFVIFQNTYSQTQDISTKTSDYFDIIRPEFTGDLAYETTAFVEQFWRVAGNEGFNKSIFRIVDKLKAAGYKLESDANASDRLVYRIETRPMHQPTWEPVDGSVTILGEAQPLLDFTTNRNMIYQNASSTPKEGVTAEVIYVKSVNDLEQTDVKGKIIYTEASFYQMYREAILNKGALALMTYNNPEYLQPEKNVTSIQFRQMPFDDNKINWAIALSYQAKEHLKSVISKGVTKVKVTIDTKIYPSEELTVVAMVKGSEFPQESLVFSAHVQEPGASDNATGVGTQLEMAMLTSHLIENKSIEAKRSLVFLWGDEIISTQRYIAQEGNPKIKWGISLDMVGENTKITGGSFLIEKMPDPSAIWTRGKDKHSEWGGQPLQLKDMKPHYLNDFIIKTFEKQGKFANWEVNTNPFEGGSDHTPFLKADIPGLLLWHFTDQFYHTDNDRLDKVSKTTMQNVGTSALVSALTLINADTSTAKYLLSTIYESAIERLNTEFILSKAALTDNSTLDLESEILDAWNDWYQLSIASVADIVNSEVELQLLITEKQFELDELTQTLKKALK